MDDDELYARSLDAQGPTGAPPERFADDVMARWDASKARPARAAPRVAGVLALAASVALAITWGATGRAREGAVLVDDAGPRTVAIGGRATAVFEAGTRAHWRTAGWFGGGDEVVIDEGAGFFRVDRGGGFVVRGPHGEARVTGTCFRVATTARDARQTHGDDTMRARWFGAGALSMAMMVAVYEGGVRVASANGRSVAVSPGQSAIIDAHGALRREDSATPGSTARAANGANPAGDPSASAGAVGGAAGARETAANTANGGVRATSEAEVARLRAILTQHGISPDTGALVPHARRGIDDDGETDLTPDEWRTLAQRGELRYRIPGGRAGRDPVDEDRARRLGVPEADRAEVNRAFSRAQERLMGTLRALYREAAGSDPGTLSMEALCNEIHDKTPDDVLGHVTWQLSQERGGVQPWQAPRADMVPYERMMRTLVMYEGDLERDLAPLVGDRIAHEVLHGENQVSAHSYGMTGRAGDAGR